MKKTNYGVMRHVRVAEDQYDAAMEVLKKEGFTFSDAVRMLLATIIKEKRLPRALSTKEDEALADESAVRENYIDRLIKSAGFERGNAEEELYKVIFGPENVSEMKNSDLREWAQSVGLPDELSIGTIADLFDNWYMPKNPFSGKIDARPNPAWAHGKGEKVTIDSAVQCTLLMMEDQENLRMNLNEMRDKMLAKGIKYLYERYNLNDKNDPNYIDVED